MKIVLIDYGIGNLRSVAKAIEKVGHTALQTSDPEEIIVGDKVILPGVGGFKDGIQGLKQRGLISVLRQIVDRQTALLGICLGMQLLFNTSSEMGASAGLGFIEGNVKKFRTANLKVPHTGWNQLQMDRSSCLFGGIKNNAYVYFNHSYYCVPQDPDVSIAKTDYGIAFASACQFGSNYGVQFHPEKSQDVGLRIIKNFIEVCE